MSESKKEFVSEAEDLIRDTEDGLLDMREKLPGQPRPDVLNAVFRSMHTLKGLSGLFGLQGTSQVSHAMETLLDEIRLGKREFNEPTVRFLLQNLDILKSLMAEVSSDGQETTDTSEAIAAIEAFRSGGGEAGGGKGPIVGIPPEIARVLSEYEEHRLRTAIKDGHGVVSVGVEFDILSFEEGLKAVTDKINSLGELIATMPKATEVQPGNIGFDLIVGTRTPEASLAETFAGHHVKVLVAAPAASAPATASAAPAPRAEAAEAATKEAGLKSASSTVRVDIAKLDAILNTVGELVLAKGAVGRIASEFIEVLGFSNLGLDLQKVAKTLEKRLTELQSQILEIRMVPVSQIFSRLTRVVRRYTRDRGKDIDLQLFGEETEVDTLLAEEVIDPLMHLIRNSIDHGIENPDVRVKSGKSATGVVTLRAFPRGNHVVFQISDDGAGINLDKVLSKAVERGIVPRGSELSREEIIQLIFEAGLSTAAAVSETSGRGVGMDVVKEKISSLGGFVEVETQAGKGTTFFVTIPITLAIIKAILVEVAGEALAIPLVSTAETLLIEESSIQHIEGREVLHLRGEMLPLVRLEKVFRFQRAGERADSCYVVVTGFAGRRMGFVVDDLIGQQDVVIKALGKHFEKLRGIAGAAEVGKHKVVLVLDVEALMEEATSSSKIQRSARAG